MDCSLPVSSVHGISQARILEKVAISFSQGYSWSRDQTQVSYITVDSLLTKPLGKPLFPVSRITTDFYVVLFKFSNILYLCLLTQSCPTLCDPMDCSLPGSTVLGILQARILEWVAISFSRVSSPPRDWTQVSFTASRLFTTWDLGEAQEQQSHALQSIGSQSQTQVKSLSMHSITEM